MARSVVCLAGVFLIGVNSGEPRMEREANRFIDLLTPAQRSATVLAPGSETRFDWHFVPKERHGVAWKQMTAAQREAGMDLLRASLSQAGLAKVEAIRQLELVLRELENGNAIRDPEDYHFLFFGKPSAQGTWAWRYEGHHTSLSFAYRDGKLYSSSPQFLGSNPGKSKAGEPLTKEKELAFVFLESLNAGQRTKAVVSQTAPPDIVTSANRKASIRGREGIAVKHLTPAQRKLLVDLVLTHAEVQTPVEQARRLASFQAEDPKTLVFAWMGSTDRKGPHYYRIQGDRLLIEYDNTQNGANHVHSVWRDLTGNDWGEDLLKAHYAASHR